MDTEPADMDALAARVLAHVASPDYHPVKPRVIAKQLGLPRERLPDLKRAVKQLVQQGRLAYGSKHLVRPATPGARRDRGAVVGIFRRAAAGYGFVSPRSSQAAATRSEDVFIPAGKTRDASDGDLVAVRLTAHPRRNEPRLRGEVIEVLERETHRFVGVYLERGGSGFVQVDGRVFADPVYVGDPGAARVQAGDKVVIEMVRFPSHVHVGEAVITEVLGARGSPGVDTLAILREFDLPEEFPPDALDTARAVAAQFEERIGEGRRDLTQLTTVTIDPQDARDFDDAISLERLDSGHWQLGVHIADVSHFVPPGSPLDREARERGTSVYLPDRVVPMLPEIISNHLASLQPGRLRYTKSVLLELTPEGAVVAAELCHSAIRSRRRFTYEEVDTYLDHRHAGRGRRAPEEFLLLERMHDLAMLLRARRRARGAIELTIPEIKVDIGRDGQVQGAHLVPYTDSHKIIEEFMLAANEAVARRLHEAGLHFLRRIHRPPDPRKLRALGEFVRELGIRCSSLESRFEIQSVVEQAAGRPEEYAVNLAVLRSMQKAVYSPEAERHYALHSDHYCHFTAPIRRYPDLTIHRMLDALLGDRRPADDFEGQVLLGEHCSRREQRAENAERELTRVKLLSFLSQRVGLQMEAVVTGVERYGLFAQGTELPAEGFIHVRSLDGDYYRYDPQTRSLTGYRQGHAFRLGDLVRVEVARVDVDARELDFRLLGRKGRGQARPKAEEKPPGPRLARKPGTVVRPRRRGKRR